jgi:hypothetical protein
MEHLCMYTYVYMLGSTTASHAQQKESQEFNYIKGRMSLDHVFKKNVQSECTYLVVLAIVRFSFSSSLDDEHDNQWEYLHLQVFSSTTEDD